MAQTIVYDWLKKQRGLSDKWFDVKEIKENLQAEGLSNGALQGIHADLYKLSQYELIECKGVGYWKHEKLFRAYKTK